ncbi:hypothetical protein SAMN05192566_2082 [Methylophilus rhizosphaerae]|uniref:Uncharacterized protein n=2 Tax=Methylophilus rhizosphaerae TaxID=492660 RepID=A0A1G9DZP6_9PROT|nr:hypothetical protein SAMN05192566_2082 [Methylophilus rhizosphaerae]
MVSDPARTFKSMDEYYNYTRTFSGNYFRGRILGSDEGEAEITLVFNLGDYRYEICRGMFEPDELRRLTIKEYHRDLAVLETDGLSRSERNRAYIEYFVRHSNVSTFEEFAFLQHFVFSFDEQRKTLFWNQAIMERVLYRTFGIEPDMAKQADLLRREIEKRASDVRNRQWEATRLRRRINEIQSKVQSVPGAQETYDSLITTHELLSEQFDEETKLLNEIEASVKDANLKLAEHSMKETALRDEYALFFERSFNHRPSIAEHPLIIQTIHDKACGLCGNQEAYAIDTVLRKSKEKICPICDSEVNPEPQTAEDIKRLEDIDRSLSQIKQAIRDVLHLIKGLNEEESKLRQKWVSTKTQLDEFNQKNNTTLDALRRVLNEGGLSTSLTIYAEQLASLEKEKNDAYSQREVLRNQLQTIQKSLEKSYVDVEKDFVKKFADLAHQFLGMPLTVQLDANNSDGPKLIVSVRGSTRREQQQLSESQRFFLDIALRMALTQHMSDPSSLGGMFIDTPEGSLDIAYEKRAGDMLAMFAKSGHQIFMTANLNSSQLLLALARSCGRQNMQLCRMTDWAELTTVQQEEESLFNEAYAVIEQAMDA